MAGRRSGTTPHLISLLFVTILLLAATSAHAAITAEAELGYADYQSEQFGGKKSGSSFTQRYSLLYATEGRLASGAYHLNLGYEWASVNTDIHLGNGEAGSSGGDNSISDNKGHLLYNGVLVFDPKDMPIRLRAYSRDTRRTSFTTQGYSATLLAGTDAVVEPDLVIEARGGTSITSGALLILGLKNSMSNAYNSIFADLPRITIDYWDHIERDTQLLTSVDSRQTKLGIILNKKDNWLHYRQEDFTDHVNPAQSFNETKFIVGQIDEQLERQWVDLTNWIQVSADGTFVKRTEQEVRSTEETDANLMSIWTREKWRARTVSTYSRSKIGTNQVTYNTSNPVYLKGIWGSEADWITQFNYSVDKTLTDGAVSLYTSDTSGSLQVNTFKRSSFNLSSKVSVESYEQNQDKSLIVGLRLESASTRRFSDVLTLIGSYDIKLVRSDGTANGNSLMQILSGNAAYRITNRLTAEVAQEIDLVNGSRNNSTSVLLSPTTLDNETTSPSQSYVRSYTRARLNWLPTERLQVLAMVTEDYLSHSGEQANSVTTLTQGLSYRLAKLDLATEVTYSKRSGEESRDTMLAKGSLNYAYDRNTAASLKARYARSDRVSSTSTLGSKDVSKEFELEQKFFYTYIRNSGQGRKLLELVQTFTYLQREGYDPDDRKTLGVNAKFYLTRNIYLAGAASYALIFKNSIDKTEVAGAGEVGIIYPKLQANLSYSYGKRDSSLADSRTDKRFAANLRKQF